MMYAPHILQRKDMSITNDEFGRPIFGDERWTDVTICRCDDNMTQEFKSENGEVYRPKFHVVCEKCDIKAGDFDMMFRAVLFCVEFPNANTIKQHFRVNGVETGFDTPITVNGNKVTLDMNASNPAFRDVEMYMFQDKDDTQLHMYMPTSSFINYFANLELVTMMTEGKIDPADAAAVEKVFADMESRVESINVSFVLKARK